jgi:hypothetical protein
MHSPAKAGEAEDEASDARGWEAYEYDWRHYFDCMLSPVAQQAAGARLLWLLPDPLILGVSPCMTAGETEDGGGGLKILSCPPENAIRKWACASAG